ncbi:MAG TPA: nuclear transport factor 2 family protein [Micromonospora sp.]
MIGSTTRTPLETASFMLDSLKERNLDGVLDCFDKSPDVFIYPEGPRWTNKGGERIHKGWRDYFQAPIRLLNWQWTEGPEVFEGADLALVCGVIQYEFEGAGQPRPLRMRMTWGLRRGADGVWRIIHEHGSQPLPDPYGTGDWLRPDTNA